MGNNFGKFYKENKLGLNNTVIFTFISPITIYFTLNNLYFLILSIPITIMSIVGIYSMIREYSSFIKKSSEKKEFRKKEKLIEEETKVFQKLPFEKKKKYLNENPNTLIYSYVSEHIIEEETKVFQKLPFEKKKKYLNENPNTLIYSYVSEHIQTLKKIKKLQNLIEIENKLTKKFDDQFYLDINILNFDEKLKLILNSIKEDESKEFYFKEKILDDKVKFFTFFKIFNDDLYNIDLNPLKSFTYTPKHKISFKSNLSLNENFILKQNEILKITKNPFKKSLVHFNSRGKVIYLKTNIEKHLINNYKKIFGNSEKINNLNKLYKKYKDLESRYIYFNEMGFENRLGSWNYKFYEKEKKPEISSYTNDDNNYTIEGEKVYQEINLILENKS